MNSFRVDQPSGKLQLRAFQWYLYWNIPCHKEQYFYFSYSSKYKVYARPKRFIFVTLHIRDRNAIWCYCSLNVWLIARLAIATAVTNPLPLDPYSHHCSIHMWRHALHHIAHTWQSLKPPQKPSAPLLLPAVLLPNLHRFSIPIIPSGCCQVHYALSEAQEDLVVRRSELVTGSLRWSITKVQQAPNLKIPNNDRSQISFWDICNSRTKWLNSIPYWALHTPSCKQDS